MKQIALMMAALGASLAFSACQDSADDHPTLGKTEGQVVDILNVPEGINMPLQFTQDNQADHLHLSCQKPTEYGFSAPISYQVEVSLNSDFSSPAVEGAPASVVLPTAFQTNTEINPTYKELAKAMRDMLDVQSPDQVPTPYYSLYLRLITNVLTASGQAYEGTMLLSNTVIYDQVSVGYMDVVVAGRPSGIYIKGEMNSWDASSDWEFLSTSTPGLYEIESCEIAKGTNFKIADANWGPIDYGLNGTALEFNRPIRLDYKGGNITMPADFSGSVQLMVEGTTYTVTFLADEPDIPGVATGIYVKGSFNGWSDMAECEFVTTDIKDRLMIADITIAAGEFKVATADWSTVNLGTNGEPIAIGVRYALTPGAGNIVIDQTFTGAAKLVKKDGNYFLILEPVE